jgi:hypothetical protein
VPLRIHLGRLLHRSYASAWRHLDRLTRLLADLPVVFASPTLERFGNDDHYRRSKKYRDPADQQKGLFPFEEAALKAFFPPPPARLLVPGAGGGREVLALSQRGYLVDAFDPVADLVEAATRLTACCPGVKIWQATVEDWADNASGVYDGVFTGGAMWTHMMHERERLRALEAFSKVCPSGPLL